MKITRWNGGRIDRAGCYSGIPLNVYHSQCCVGPSVSSGNLRRVLECNGGSAAHFYSEWSGNPRPVPRKENREMILGRAAHHLLLGEPNFRMYYAIRPERFDSWRTQASQDWRAEQEAQGLSVLTPEDILSIKGMADSLAVAQLAPSEDLQKPAMYVHELLVGQIEISFIWQDEFTGLWIKARPDAAPTSGDFGDLKTTASVQYYDLVRALSRGAHHQAAANVLQGAKVCTDIVMQSFALVYCERDPPYCVRPVFLKDDDIARGARQNRAALSIIARGLETGHWPGPGGNRVIERIDLSDWYRGAADFEIGEIQHLADSERRSGTRRRA
jgi:hypothetical protein